MKWNKKVIDKPVEKEKSVLSTRPLGIVRKLKPVIPLENRRTNMLDPVDYQARRLTQDVLLKAEHRKAEVLTLIRRMAFI